MAVQGVPARAAMEGLGHAQSALVINAHAHSTAEFQWEASERLAATLWPESRAALVLDGTRLRR